MGVFPTPNPVRPKIGCCSDRTDRNLVLIRWNVRPKLLWSLSTLESHQTQQSAALVLAYSRFDLEKRSIGKLGDGQFFGVKVGQMKEGPEKKCYLLAFN